jgi:hypothetical protein
MTHLESSIIDSPELGSICKAGSTDSFMPDRQMGSFCEQDFEVSCLPFWRLGSFCEFRDRFRIPTTPFFRLLAHPEPYQDNLSLWIIETSEGFGAPVPEIPEK